MGEGTIVSGGMAHKVNYLYGKFEFRVKTDPDPAGIMSGVVLTWPQSERWPNDGEIDIYETGPGGSRDNFYTFVHYGSLPDNHQFPGYRYDTPSHEWHTMTYEWTSKSLKFYLDGQLTWTVTDANAIPKVPHHICIQLDASQTGTLYQPTKMYIDWVKIYQQK
jgi:beta-glucanase (GH16 family)